MEPNNNVENNMTSNTTDSNPVVAEVKNVTEENSGNQKLTMPMAIVIAGVLIAIALIITGGKGSMKTKNAELNIKEASELRSMRPIDSTDHIRGDITKAKVAIIEYSDLQCPYCKAMHPNLQSALDSYKGDVVWVYRHFPLESIHPYARPAAIASECAAELGGNDAFWKFADGIFGAADTSILETANMSKLAASLGINQAAFDSCTTSGKYDKVIDSYIEDANNAGAQGTPDLTVVNLKTNEAVHIGADPRIMAQVLEKMLVK